MWEIEGTDEFAAWYRGLTEAQSESVDMAVRALELGGPALGRPYVDSLTASRHANMKELRPRGGNLRILFAFDPRRSAILLLGGDKTGRWGRWYREAIPIADDLYDEHLETLKKEGLI
ncbi:MAG TPA: type II toxin-antitoxin system RelE/ParE family toxin [Thermomicrobiales bacterium]|jgi:hypothetical protein